MMAHDASVPHKQGLHAMPRVEAVWRHPVFQREYTRLTELERERVFCRHDIRHLMDTARIMWARNLELELGINREVIYAAALLHDIGKAAQYEGAGEHEIVGAAIAAEILDDLPEQQVFTPEEREMMLTAIRGHRRLREDAVPFERLLYQADKASRACFACPEDVRTRCSWPDAKKNLSIAI